MSPGRIVGAAVASATVAGCAVVVVGIARSGADTPAAHTEQAGTGTHAVQNRRLREPILRPLRTSTAASGPATAGTQSTTSARTHTSPARSRPTSVPPSSQVVTSTQASTPASSPTDPAPAVVASSRPSSASPTPTLTLHATTSPPHATVTAKPTPTQHPTTQHPTTQHPTTQPSKTQRPKTQPSTARRGRPLPLHKRTGRATRVITVVASSRYSTTARLQAWRKAPGGGWLRVGRPTRAHVGSDGLSGSPSEYRSATPIGSFTLTQAFGHYANPGTRLHYFKTTPADWWISQAGRLYNTHRRCWSHCRFNQGSPNEHLYYETPFYNYAVVIDYNTRNTGHVRQGAGSAFFLHVTDGNPTAGCVAIAQSKLVRIMRWLRPRAHPRILIGVS